MIENNKEIMDVIQQLTSFDKMYQMIRIVDPVLKKVLTLENNEFLEERDNCYSFWGKNEVCKNCVSMRAYNEKESFIKIEYNQEKIYMVTAIPIVVKEKKIIVELLKDITRSMIWDDQKLKEQVEMQKLLYQANVAVVMDELTQIYNKRYLIEKLPVEMIKAKSENKSVALIMGDIDFFKKVNDTYGHLAGDYILKEFASILKSSIRKEEDWVARFGGEEFIVCIKNGTKEEVMEIAEKIRKKIEAHHFFYKEQEIRITASFGVCEYLEDQIKDYDDFIVSVDKNLYTAKNSGRNQVIG
jgi:diguanylate cyclase (GGDEF)-like protein